MNRKLKGIFLCSLFLILSAKNSNDNIGSEINGGKEHITYIEMLEVLQIQNEEIQKMPTEQLLNTCIDCPLIFKIWLNSSVQEGVEILINEYNGLQELLIRKDAGTELLKIYMKMDPHAFYHDWNDIQRGKYTFKFAFVEMLLAQETIISLLTKEERLSLLQELLNKQKHMSEYPIYDIKNQESNIFLIGKIIQKDYSEYMFSLSSEQNDKLQYFLRRGSHSIIGTKEMILYMVNKIINEL
ncbi:MAG: hypothetical protein K9N05_02435 [Candidatus Marinimicrobia bacterium]|nr:hypothetical protein [Candidatus Neomarinimicrobiota bacterium]